MAGIEAEAGTRLGVALLDAGPGATYDWRGDGHFAMASTDKFLVAAAVLRRVDERQKSLERSVTVAAADLVDYAPIMKPRVGQAMTVAEFCEAALTSSDNAAANLLLATMGGPEGLTRFACELGDTVARLDRVEPALNEAAPDDPRDTTTPRAMLGLMDRLLVGDVLSAASRARLTG